jgi:hypothetical protein
VAAFLRSDYTACAADAGRDPPSQQAAIQGVDEMTDTTLSRRHLLAGASATAAAAAGLVGTALPAAAKAPLVKTQAPAFYRFNVGSIEATVVSDGLIVAVPKDTFVGPAATNVEKMMTDLFLPPDRLVMDQNALVINTGDKLALFETGMASVKRTEEMGLLVGNLKAAGIDPKDIRLSDPKPRPHRSCRRHPGCRRQPQFPQCADLHLAGRSRILDQ